MKESTTSWKRNSKFRNVFITYLESLRKYFEKCLTDFELKKTFRFMSNIDSNEELFLEMLDHGCTLKAIWWDGNFLQDQIWTCWPTGLKEYSENDKFKKNCSFIHGGGGGGHKASQLDPYINILHC